jgi:hypothetical protein
MLRHGFLALGAALLLAGGARAEGPQLQVTPFLGSFVQNAWQPVEVSVDLPRGGAAFTGEVHLSLTDPHTHRHLGAWSHALSIPAGGHAKANFTVFVPVAGLPIAEAELVSGSGRTSLTLASSRFEGIKVRPTTARVILNLSQNPDALQEIEGKTIWPDEQKHSRSYLSPQAISPEALPESPLALDGVSAIFTDASTQLTPAQSSFLERYVASGGLLVSAGDVSTRVKTGLGLRATLVPGNRDAWRNALVAKSERSLVVRQLDHNEYYGGNLLGASVVVGEGLTPPPLSIFVLFLGVYLLVLIPIQYAVLKKLGKREWAWGVTPALALGFSVLAFGYARQGRSVDSFVNAASVVETMAGAKTGRTLTRLGLFSPDYRRYDLGASAEQLTPAETSEVHDAGGIPTLRGLSVPMWSMKQATALGETRLGEGLEVVREGQNLRIINRLGQPLSGVRIVKPNRELLWVGDIPSGATRIVALYGPNHDFTTYAGETASPEQKMKQMLSDLTYSYLPNADSSLRVTGWLGSVPTRVFLEGKEITPRHHVTLLVAHVPAK